jgi:uncharacterized membrane protein
MAFSPKWTDQEIEKLLGHCLRAGVLLAASVVLLGGTLYLLHYGWTIPDYRVFRGEPADFRNISGVFEDTLRLSGRGIIQFGLLLLIATPITRVILAMIGFARQRDFTYLLVALIVLSLLMYSLLDGHFYE